MYSKILIPTDGSDISKSAVRAGVEFARQLNAQVLGIFVAPEYQYPIYIEVIPPSFPSEEEYRASMIKAGEIYLDDIRNEAKAAGVKFAALTTFSNAIAHEIVYAAEYNGCDLIFMGSHGRSGWEKALLGSVTTKVLSTCQVPVLVHRTKKSSRNQTDKKS